MKGRYNRRASFREVVTAAIVLLTVLLALIAMHSYGRGADIRVQVVERREPEMVTYHYDQSLPGVYWSQSWKGLYPVGFNPAGTLDPTGTANNERPWKHPGGLDDCGPEVTVKRTLQVPRGRKIKVWHESRDVVLTEPPRVGHKMKVSRIAGKFPNRTRVVEDLYDEDRLFERRERFKRRGKWHTSQEKFGKPPKGYVEVDNCTDCHEDIGRDSMEIDSSRDWYSAVRGLEKDGPIHWHPWSVKGLGSKAIPLKIRYDVRDIVEWVEK